jgi:hypothetical protein
LSSSSLASLAVLEYEASASAYAAPAFSAGNANVDVDRAFFLPLQA